MINNDVMRSVRYILNVNDAKIAEITRLTGCEIPDSEALAYLKKEDEDGYISRGLGINYPAAANDGDDGDDG